MVAINLVWRVVRRIIEIPWRGLPELLIHDDFDKGFGTETSGIVWLTCPGSRNFTSGGRYQACRPSACEWAIEHAEINPHNFSFVDIGSGKGRPLLIASRYHFRELIGVDYSKRLCRIAEKNLAKYGVNNFRIVCHDATEFTYPSNHTFAFFYNPFSNAELLAAVLKKLQAATAGYQLVITYVGPGKSAIASQEWLTPYQQLADVTLFRKNSTLLH